MDTTQNSYKRYNKSLNCQTGPNQIKSCKFQVLLHDIQKDNITIHFWFLHKQSPPQDFIVRNLNADKWYHKIIKLIYQFAVTNRQLGKLLDEGIIMGKESFFLASPRSSSYSLTNREWRIIEGSDAVVQLIKAEGKLTALAATYKKNCIIQFSDVNHWNQIISKMITLS